MGTFYRCIFTFFVVDKFCFLTSKLYKFCSAISAHKFVIVFCVSLELLQTEPTMLVFFSYLGTFSLVTPLGIGLGMVFSGDDLTVAVLQGTAKEMF